ncbi:MAG: MBL fold metallo-hydrolase [Pseudomonadota bacterium]
MKVQLLACILICGAGNAAASPAIADKRWIHGAADCKNNQDPAIEVFEVDAATYVLRQNKCTHFEAPFTYVFFGQHTVFVQDTGATADAGRYPLYDTLQGLIQKRGDSALQILVSHSHSHGDHTAADSQFRGKPGVVLIEPRAEAVQAHFGFTAWPQGEAQIDLGERRLTVILTPGHQDEAIAVHDAHTGWLLTGDTLYPGRIFVKNWSEYRASIQRLLAFSTGHPVSAVLGSHIEMSRAGQLYPLGSQFQPDEASLVLTVSHLAELHTSLLKAGDSPKPVLLPWASVTPVGMLQRVVGGVLKALGVR